MKKINNIMADIIIDTPRIDPEDTRAFVRDFYKDPDPNIKSIRWETYMTPIERELWRAFQDLGFPVWPLYPFHGFVLDFAWKDKKIAFEADGKAWHQDKDRDKTRDLVLQSYGWKTYRFSGKSIMGNGPISWNQGHDYTSAYKFLIQEFDLN